MKKIVNIILVLALLVGSTTSCSDFLQKDPPSSPSQSIFGRKRVISNLHWLVVFLWYMNGRESCRRSWLDFVT